MHFTLLFGRANWNDFSKLVMQFDHNCKDFLLDVPTEYGYQQNLTIKKIINKSDVYCCGKYNFL